MLNPIQGKFSFCCILWFFFVSSTPQRTSDGKNEVNTLILQSMQHDVVGVKSLSWFHHSLYSNKGPFIEYVTLAKLHSFTMIGARPGAVAQWLASLHLTSGTQFNSWCLHVRQKFHPGHKCHSAHYRGPCLLGITQVKVILNSLIHPSINHKDRLVRHSLALVHCNANRWVWSSIHTGGHDTQGLKCWQLCHPVP